MKISNRKRHIRHSPGQTRHSFRLCLPNAIMWTALKRPAIACMKYRQTGKLT